MLEVENLNTYYGDSHILQGLSLSVRQGEVVALIGRNGMGKTTTIHSIVGLTPPRSGRVLFHGVDLRGQPAHMAAQRGIGLVPQGRRIFPTLTVQENLLLAWRQGRRRSRDRGWDLPRIYQVLPRLVERRGQHGHQLSGGEQSMLAIARALLLNPDLLLMDEPSEGLSPLILQELTQVLTQLKAAGQSILLVEQFLPLALSLADRVLVMTKGRIVHQATPAALQERSDILHSHLGV